MNNNNGALSFEAFIKTDAFKNGTKLLENQIRGLTTVAEQETKRIDAAFSKMGTAIGGYLSFTGAKQFVNDIIRVRGEFQKLQVSFTTMLGSKEKSDALMAQITATAASTPFGLQEVAQGAKQLLAYGTAAEDVNGTLIRLGNIASGLSVPLNDLIYLYGTSATQGRLMTQDLNQFAGRGVPIFEELAKVMGVSKDQIKDLAAEGKISFEMLQKVIQNLTDQGGMFFNLMQEQSKTITGQISNLEDAWDHMLNEIGKANEGLVYSTIEGLSSLIENYEALGKVIVVLIATYGSYRAAIITIAALERIIAASKVATVYLEMAAALGQVTMAHRARALAIGIEARAQAALNAIMSINPYVALAAALGALTAAIWVNHDGTTAQERAQKELNDTLEESARRIEDLKAKTAELNAIITGESQAASARFRAYAQLQGLYPGLLKNMSLQQYAAMGLVEAMKLINEQIEKNKIADDVKAYEAAAARLKELEAVAKTLQFGAKTKEEAELAAKWIEQGTGSIQKEIQIAIFLVDALKKKVEENTQAQWEANTPLEEKIRHYQTELQALKVQRSQLETTLLLSGKIASQFAIWGSAINAIKPENLNAQIADIMARLGGAYGGQGEAGCKGLLLLG